jgi:hypothetical protein
MLESELKEYIRELVREIQMELDETTTTASVDGYQTPFAFSGGRTKDKKKKKDIIDASGYEEVK